MTQEVFDGQSIFAGETLHVEVDTSAGMGNWNPPVLLSAAELAIYISASVIESSLLE